jgi:hypothetical protein
MLTQQELDRIGISLSVDEFMQRVVDAVSSMGTQTDITDPRSALSQEEIDVLERGGFDLRPLDASGFDPIGEFVATYAAIVASSLTTREAAARLGVDESRIRQRLANRTLYGVKSEGQWRVPLFQFEGEKLIPGWNVVLPRFDPTLHPVSLYNWFHLPDPDLEIADESVSPRAWLISGGDPEIVARLASDL